jgi:hypothetical protein
MDGLWLKTEHKNKPTDLLTGKEGSQPHYQSAFGDVHCPWYPYIFQFPTHPDAVEIFQN